MGDTGALGAVTEGLEEYRRELNGYCYRMLGSYAEAEDAVQEALVRAWRGVDRFEGRSGLRTWLYRIATNVCLDALASGKRRALPMDLSGPSGGGTPPEPPQESVLWVEPCPGGSDPEAAAAVGESVRLAFVAALQHLPPRQRATLILRDVLGFAAREVADLHGCSVASANSSLQRARSTMADRRGTTDGPAARPSGDSVRQVLAERYSSAFSRYDVEELNMLLHVDATLCLPPYAKWMRGVPDIHAWLTGPAIGCRARGQWALHRPEGDGSRCDRRHGQELDRRCPVRLGAAHRGARRVLLRPRHDRRGRACGSGHGAARVGAAGRQGARRGRGAGRP
ncbi:RNA polymerase subunit sigma-70 [Streptomyces erythrochromogenes]|uniref:RNA polymerase subunit sigma-70 n=1 Tax=Streptomyces erythrochromogenes TaxID=285574 RepID=UPI0037F68F7E